MTDQRPIVSIVTPTLNQAGFIEDALASVAGQTYEPIEHIVVDGGSNDGTLEILRRWGETGRIRWISGPDLGMYDAINKGLAITSGSILAYLNSDDLYFPWTVAAAVAGLARRPKAGAVFGDSITVELSTGAQYAVFQPPFRRSIVAAAGPWAGLIVQPTVFWRRSAWETIGPFDANLRFVGDREYFLRLGRLFPVERLDEFLAIERHHAAALSTAQREQLAREDQRAIRRSVDWHTRLRVRTYAACWRRVLWARFALAVVGGRTGGPWSGLRTSGMRLSPWRALLAQLPRVGYRFLPDAIRTDCGLAGRQP